MNDLDGILTGIIILLLVMVVYKWCGNRICRSKVTDYATCTCTCKGNVCHCAKMKKSRCPGGCKCGCPPGQCKCGPGCKCMREGFEETGPDPAHVESSGPQPATAAEATQNYAEVIQDMSLEAGVADSHKSYCDSLAFAGLPTGASSCTTLEETGRSYGTADFVGLTARKFCKARQLATPAADARVTPSQSITEWCDIGMDELV